MLLRMSNCVGDYIFRKRIGKGAFSTIYKGKHRHGIYVKEIHLKIKKDM